VTKSSDKNKARQIRRPEVVYHYTSAETLLKIVASRTIWATNLRYLNDVSESDYCLRLLRRRVPRFLKANPSSDGQILTSVLNKITLGDLDAPFVASFSSLPDSLPQWRSYCPNGNGASIGFEALSLNGCTIAKENPDKSTDSVSLDFVRYISAHDLQTQDGIIQSCLTTLREWRALPKVHSFPSLPIEEAALKRHIKAWATVVKHSAFEAENEYRLIATSARLDGNDVKFRCSKTTVIPYLELYLPESEEDKMGDRTILKEEPSRSEVTRYDYFIREIIVGPTPNPDLTVGALTSMFQSRLFGPKIRKSTIPFRDL
jgi:hypothetical protein